MSVLAEKLCARSVAEDHHWARRAALPIRGTIFELRLNAQGIEVFGGAGRRPAFPDGSGQTTNPQVKPASEIDPAIGLLAPTEELPGEQSGASLSFLKRHTRQYIDRHADEFARVAQSKGFEQDGVHHGEHGNGPANADAQRKDCRERKAWRGTQSLKALRKSSIHIVNLQFGFPRVGVTLSNCQATL
jgi:hypothetical protein